MVLALVVLAVLVVGGVRQAPPRDRRRRRRHRGARSCALVEPYRRARMLTFLHPCARRVERRLPGHAVAHRARQRRAGPASGSAPAGPSGTSCPNAHTDFIFAIIGEELGLIGCFARGRRCSSRFAVLGMRAALRAPDRFGMLLAAGITVWIVGQAVINIGAVVGLLPVSGHPAAVRVVRWLGARVHDGRGRHARQRRPPGRATPAAATRPASPRDGDRGRRPRSAAAVPAVTSIPALALADELVAAGTPASDPLRRRPARPRGRPRSRRPATRSTCCPAAASSAGSARAHLAQNVRAAWRHASSPSSGRSRLVRRLRPAVVVGVGGYASLPALVARPPLRRPDRGPRADAASRARQPDRGAPRRARRGRRSRARRSAGRWSPATRSGPRSPPCARAPVAPPLVAVVGGSLGARRSNGAALDLYDRWRDRERRRGPPRDAASATTKSAARRLAALRRPGDALGYDSSPFEEHMEALYADATLVVCRVGRA